MQHSHLLVRFCLASILTFAATSSNAIGPYDQVYFNGAEPYLDGNQTLIVDGIRAEGNGLTLDDSLSFRYQFDPLSLNWELTEQTIYTDIGVFDDEHMAIDVTPSQPTFVNNGNSYASGKIYTITATKAKPWVANLNLKPGHVMSWYINYPSSDYLYKFQGNSIYSSFNGAKNQGVISGANTILQAGTYTLTISPKTSTSFKASLMIFNANNMQLTQLYNGSYINVGFVENIRDYAKYKVSLSAGQTLNLPKSSSDIRFTLINKFGAVVYTSTGLPLIFDATETGDYYLFIDNLKGWGGRYNGKVAITTTVSSTLPTANKTRAKIDKATPAR